MADSKHMKYVVTELKPDRPLPPLPKGSVTDVMFLDDEVIKGAFNVICAWFWPRKEPLQIIPEPHSHDNNEVIAFFGSNPEDPHDLCGEVEIWLEDEKLTINKSCAIFVPAGMKHNPLKFNRIDRPIFHFSILTENMYTFDKK
jgi:hypothetical protein